MAVDRSILNIIHWMNSKIFSGKWIFRPIKIYILVIFKHSLSKNLKWFLFSVPGLLIFFLSISVISSAQQVDTLKAKDSIPSEKVDSLIKTEHSPRKAAIRSAIIPGWGQVYNKKYWKVPIIYAALGITGYIFIDNLKTYKDLKFSYAAKYKASLPPFDSANPRPGPYQDSTDYKKMKCRYQPISLEALRQGRNQFRQYINYYTVFFIVFWGLNIVDTAVDTHLNSFNI